MRREALYLADVVESANAIRRFVEGATREEFVGDDLLRSAVHSKLIIIGEAVANLPEEFRSTHPGTDWRRITAFRNLIVHAYFGIDWLQVWDIVTVHVPALLATVTEIISNEYPELVPTEECPPN